MDLLMSNNLSIASWNVRGLNNRARRAAVRALLAQLACSIICLQESKLQTVGTADINEIVGPAFDCYAALNADGTRGGVLLCWKSSSFTASAITTRTFSITTTFTPIGANCPWSLSAVYGPHDHGRKQNFLNELADIHSGMSGPWSVIGDFNMIVDPTDKNNDRVCRRWMNKFRCYLNRSSLHEVPLIGRKYTWSNEQASPTLVRLDRAFSNVDWELMFPAAKLLPQSSSISDHCPLLLRNDVIMKTNKRFRYESYWELIDGYMERVNQSWMTPVSARCPLNMLSMKLWRLSRDLRKWSKSKVGDIKQQLAIVNEMTLQLDAAQDHRSLSAEESGLRSKLKARSLGLAVLFKVKMRQRSRVLWLRAGDANTRFFQRKANARHNRSMIHVLHGPDGMVSINWK
ncbi:hypothetical protein D1007_29155 [Hordeum vulgare]|nr:hypothetical protein D1007_29155 [Hordeum vulgare]